MTAPLAATTTNEQFLVFAGYDYYPSGCGAHYWGSYDSEIEALSAAANCKRDWWHIVHKGEIVHESD